MPSFNRLDTISSWRLKDKKDSPKYIFVSGGVMSALGKGVTAASISMLLKKQGYKICPIKCENNLNVDFGTINPIEHGDPFLCFDGLESDVDLGNYERYLNQPVGYDNFITMGQLYKAVIDKERSMQYDGEDVEPIPHIVNEIIDRFHIAAKKSNADFVVIELGGTVGEYENNNGLYYEASRRLAFSYPVLHVHVTYVPVPIHVGEPKTKPAQFGLKDLMSMGIYPDFIVVRSEAPLDEQRKYKFAFKFNVDPNNIISNENLENADLVPLHLHNQGIDTKILKYFNMKAKKIDLTDWEDYTKKLISKKSKRAKIAIVGKYFSTGNSKLIDSYYALVKAIEQASAHTGIKADIEFINSEGSTKEINEYLKDVDGIIVPIGWGARGVEGMLDAIKFARERKIPYLGLCYGMQLACVEFAKNVLKIDDANSEEVDPKAKNKIIHSIPFDKKYQVIKGTGTSMRLGTYPCVLDKKSKTYKIYKKYDKVDENSVVLERHRHRFEFNNEFLEIFEKNGFVFSGKSPDGKFVEYIELPEAIHPFFIATQAHPEYKSTPLDPHPVFLEFVKAAFKRKK